MKRKRISAKLCYIVKIPIYKNNKVKGSQLFTETFKAIFLKPIKVLHCRRVDALTK